MFNGGELSAYVECEIVVCGHVGNVCLARVMTTEIACRPAFTCDESRLFWAAYDCYSRYKGVLHGASLRTNQH